MKIITFEQIREVLPSIDDANIQVVLNNAKLAAQIAVAQLKST